MKLHILEHPERPDQLSRWLEGYLVSPDLSLLVAELSAVHAAAEPPGRSLEHVLGHDFEPILTGGLSALPTRTLHEFLRSPRLLLRLQQEVCFAGGPYWDRLKGHAEEIQPAIERGWQRLEGLIGKNGPSPGLPTIAMKATPPQTLSPERQPRERGLAGHSAVACAAMVAVVLIAACLWQARFHHPAQPQWGWNRPSVMTASESASDYLNRLAGVAEEWFRKRPETPDALAERILEFRRGCTALILSDHPPLSSDDRDWLVERCRVWAQKLDGHLAAIEAGEDAVQVREQADQTIRTLIAALLERQHA